jgi:hypothetical protein
MNLELHPDPRWREQRYSSSRQKGLLHKFHVNADLFSSRKCKDCEPFSLRVTKRSLSLSVSHSTLISGFPNALKQSCS